MLKAITLYEPYASLMAIGAKVNETRSVRTRYRGDICIHAAKADYGVPDDILPAVVKAFQSRGQVPTFQSKGCIVAVVELWDVQPSEKFYCEPATTDSFCISAEEFIFGNYADGRFIYRTRNLRRLATPVPCRGFQCIGWTVPPDVAAQVQAQLKPQCSFGAGTAKRCQNPPTHVSTFKGQPTKLLWCDEHCTDLRNGLQTPGHGFEKL